VAAYAAGKASGDTDTIIIIQNKTAWRTLFGSVATELRILQGVSQSAVRWPEVAACCLSVWDGTPVKLLAL
jgi:hypothetical protein